MCGRYAIGLGGEDIAERFLTDERLSFDATYNAAPNDALPIVTRDDGANHAELARWGLQPSWADENHDGFINARVETADEKESFADAWRSNRCLVPATGFYEWSGRSGGKTPYYFTRTEGASLSFAGLYASHEDTTSFTILTTEASDAVSEVHDRMPVILRRGEEGSWVLGRLAKDRLMSSRPGLRYHPVTKAVNSPSNDGVFLTEERDGLSEFTA
jgi:putative SOS response-associated peptidase YedK